MIHDNRYIRQTTLDRFGPVAQDRMTAATVAIVGCGGLGSVAAPYLAGAGVGHLILIDGDTPQISNLHRQVFFSEVPTTQTKSEAIAAHIKRLNSDVKTTVVTQMISKDNIADHLANVDLVLECTDNIQAKYLMNDFCHMQQIPMVYGAIHKYDGFVSLFENSDYSSIHLRDIFPTISADIPSCSEVGVLGTLAGLIGLMQANEAIKHITQVGGTLSGRLLSYDILNSRQMILKLTKNYANDIFETYAAHNYEMADKVCQTVPTITYDHLMAGEQHFEIISVLEDDEHEDIVDNVVRYPVSKYPDSKIILSSDKAYAVYCMSGKRSAQFVDLVLSHDPQLTIYSIDGGLNLINKRRSNS